MVYKILKQKPFSETKEVFGLDRKYTQKNMKNISQKIFYTETNRALTGHSSSKIFTLPSSIQSLFPKPISRSVIPLRANRIFI
jgi:hypothetical protein